MLLDKLTVLNKFDFFKHGSDSLRQATLENSVLVNLESGDFFFHEGDTCTKFALIGKGSLRVFKTGETGREITLYRVDEGQACLVNLTSTLYRTQTKASGLAESAVHAVLLPRSFLNDGLKRDDGLRDFVFKGLADRLAQLMSLIEEVTFRKMDMRLADYLLKRSEIGMRPVAASHEEIAYELGTAREVVSRLLRDLEFDGLVQISRKKVIVINPGSLKDRSSF